jgi:phage-related minor tail protein
MPGLSAAAGTGLKGLGAAFGLVTLPVLALTAAIGALVWLIQNGWLERAITSFKQLAFLIAYALTNMGIGSKDALLANAKSQGLTRAAGGPVSGGSPYLVGERGPEMFVPRSSGAIVPNHRLAAGGGGGITIVYSPTISTASTDEIERMGKLIEQAQRRRP